MPDLDYAAKSVAASLDDAMISGAAMLGAVSAKFLSLPAAAFILLGTLDALGAEHQRPVDKGAYRAKAMAFVRNDIADARSSGSNPEISLNLVDLNGDGIPEALVRVDSPSNCGSRGCTAYVLDLSGTTARSIGDFTAQTLTVLPTKTGAWRDLALNGVKMVFQGGKYTSAR